jgi:hypothetical protein
MNWSEEQLAALLSCRNNMRQVGELKSPPFKLPANEAGAFARGQLPADKMNKTEAAYARFLEARKIDCDILWYRFQPMNLRLANGATYKPDFGVLIRDCWFELHEVKGFWREAARVRIKVAAELFPFKFIAITRTKTGGWEREEFS